MKSHYAFDSCFFALRLKTPLWFWLAVSFIASACTNRLILPPSLSKPVVGVRGEEGWASHYGEKSQGYPTASGERYNHRALTGSHRSYPFGSYVQVTNLENNRSIVVKINDRPEPTDDKIIGVSGAAAANLGMLQKGIARVRVVPVQYGTEPTGSAYDVVQYPNRDSRVSGGAASTASGGAGKTTQFPPSPYIDSPSRSVATPSNAGYTVPYDTAVPTGRTSAAPVTTAPPVVPSTWNTPARQPGRTTPPPLDNGTQLPPQSSWTQPVKDYDMLPQTKTLATSKGRRGQWTLQIAAVSSLEMVLWNQQTLGNEVWYEEVKMTGKPPFRVYYGVYNTKAQAEAEKESLKGLGYPDCYAKQIQ